MRIFYIIDSLKIGGAEMLLLAMLKSYLPDHTLFVGYFSHGPLFDEIKALGIPVYRLSERGLKDPMVILRTWKLLRDIKPDVVHTHLFKSDFVGQISSRLAGVPVRISSLHNTNPWQKNPIYSMILRRVITGGTQLIIAVSDVVRDFTIQWSHYTEDEIVVIENGIDLEHFNKEKVEALDLSKWSIPDDAPIITMIGRLTEQKDHNNLVSAAEIVLSQAPNVRFLIVGTGELEADLKELTKTKGIEEQVIFTGIIRDIPGLMKAVDIITFSSAWEGLPVTLLEAMAMEKPIVSTAVGGIPSVIQDGENGLLVPPRDPVKLAQALLKVLNSLPLQEKLGTSALKSIQPYSATVMHQRILDIYDKFLKKASTHG